MGKMSGESRMSIYTKNGDKGTTNLVHTKNVSKADDRIQLEGTIDELSCHIGVLKTMIRDGDTIHSSFTGSIGSRSPPLQ